MDEELKAALSLSGPDACRDHYRAWARTYDNGFAAEMDYCLPAHVAAAFLDAGGHGAVLDVGAGTGLLAERLREMGFAGEIDALDFPAEMLAQAGGKRIYATLHQADITRPLGLGRRYDGIVSSGTFTAGHVGPEALANLLDPARPAAVCALSINRRVWSSAGFDRALDDLVGNGRITGLQLSEVEVYGTAAVLIDPDHAADRAVIALFRCG